ncbi:MAG: CBS domain-containing protein [Ginsengibacter sp.]
MNKVSNILSRKGYNAISVDPNTSVLDALKVMADNNIGSVTVMENDTFLGIMTERDYSRKVVLKHKNSTDTKVKEIMTEQLPSVRPDDSIDYCMELLTKNNIRYLPVMVDGKLNGIISISDVVSETIIVQRETINHLDHYINSK